MEGVRPDGHEGYVQVKVEPSLKIKYGVHIEINDHFQLKSGDSNLSSAQHATELLRECWAVSMKRGSEIADCISSIGDET